MSLTLLSLKGHGNEGKVQTLQNTDIAPTLKMDEEENLRNYRLVDETLHFEFLLLLF